MKKKLLTAIAAVGLSFLSTAAFGAAIVTVSFSSGAGKLLTDHLGGALSGGTLGVNGDGHVIQIGYFSTATVVSLFSGNWIALTGNNGVNSAFNTTSVGDGINSGAGNRAIFSVTFDLTDSTKNKQLPSAGVPLGVRIYDVFSATSPAGFYETIVSPDWVFATPLDPPLNPTIAINLTNANAKLASNNTTPGANIQTVTPTVPEPTSATLLMVGFVSLASRRRRVAKV